MRRECHGHSERTATGLFQIGEQRINHLHDGPGRRADRGSAPGNAVQDVGGYGGDSGGSVADCFDHGTLCLPEYVDITGESWFPLTLTFSPLLFVCIWSHMWFLCWPDLPESLSWEVLAGLGTSKKQIQCAFKFTAQRHMHTLNIVARLKENIHKHTHTKICAQYLEYCKINK